MKPVNLLDKLNQFSTYWDPHIITNYNDNDIMVAKFSGEFPFHLHEETDDFFLVLQGEFIMDLEGETHTVKEGEIFVVPRGVTHRPRAVEECHVLLIEPKGTPNTGDAETASEKPRI